MACVRRGWGEAIILCRWHVVRRPKVKKLGITLRIDVAGVPKKAAWKSFIIFALKIKKTKADEFFLVSYMIFKAPTLKCQMLA